MDEILEEAIYAFVGIIIVVLLACAILFTVNKIRGDKKCSNDVQYTNFDNEIKQTHDFSTTLAEGIAENKKVTYTILNEQYNCIIYNNQKMGDLQ